MPEISTAPNPEHPAARFLVRQRPLVTPAVLLAILLVISAFHGPHLFTSDGLAGAVIGAGPLVLATLAITIIAVAGPAGVDLSVGPTMTFINIGIVLGLPVLGLSGPVAVFAFAILLGMLLQAAMGTLIAVLRVSTVVVTLAIYLVLDGLNTVILPQPGGTAPDWLANWGSASSILSSILYVPLAAFVLWTLISRTTFFRNVRLMGANDRTAFVSGVKLIPTRIGAHVICGVFVGIASVMYTGLIGSADPTAGASYTLSAVTALVIGGASLAGGRARGLGSVLGAIDIWLISYVLSTFNFGLNASYWVQFATGAVLVVALVTGGVLSGLSGTGRWRGAGMMSS
ncbi:MAG TPA: ABC transporter permease [Acetobacteraceae bacterium]|nr:ABC transporter permease [Acetobacteraceae bacterium]